MRLEKRSDQQTRTESKTRLVEQINSCLHSGDYARALDLLRGTAANFPNDAQLSELENLAQDGIKRTAEANRLITESQELFAQRKSAEAIQVLRKAYELDKRNALARAILANALVEHAQALVESNWLKAETLTNQALALNPAHPTAKTILSLLVRKKETSSVEDWVSQARKLQSSGDLFAALAWVAEGLAVHPHDPKLLQIQDAIQRDQEARRRQARRGDLDDLRRMQREIEGAADVAAKQAIAERIQAVAAKHWTDGEILSIANALLLRLGLVPQDSSSASTRSKGATVILHVPRPSAPKPAPANTSQIAPGQDPPTQAQPTPARPTPVQPTPVQPSQVQTSPALPSPTASSQAAPSPVPNEEVPTAIVAPNKTPGSKTPLRAPVRGKLRPPLPKPPHTATPAAAVPVVEPPAPAAKVTSRSSQPTQPARSNSVTLILVAWAAAIILVAAILFLAQRHQAPPVANAPAATPAVPAPAASAPAVSPPAPTTPEPSLPDSGLSSDTAPGKLTPDDQPPAESGHNLGTLLIVAGQDDTRVFLNGKLQRQLTHAGQLRLPNLELKDYVVQVSKSGFQDPPQQKVRIRKGEEAKLIFNLQLQPHLASLTIQGGAPGTTVLVDQTLVGTIQPDGTLALSTVNPGDHTVELRKERFKSRQFKKHFVAGGAISLAPADAALEAAPGELKITFAPADAKVAIVKGDLLTIVSSGVPLNLAPGTYTLTARTADRFTRSTTLDIIAGQSKTLDLPLAPNGMSKFDDPGAWKHEGDSFTRKGGDFALYGVAPTSGTFMFSAMLTKGHLLQWVFNYTDSKNYVLFQTDDNNFYRSVIHNGNKTNEIIVPHKGEKKSFRTLHVRVTPTEIVHQIKQGNSWTIVDRWTQPGANLSLGKFGFYIPGNDQVALSSFAHYADLNIR
jgi:Flp pilus assembly protein TadD